MQVYEATSGTIQSEAFFNIDINGSLETIWTNVRNSGNAFLDDSANRFFERRGSDGNYASSNGLVNGVPGIDGTAFQPGDVVRFWDRAGSINDDTTFDFTVRLYMNPDDGETYMAFGEVPMTLASSASGNLFFIDGADGNFVSSQIPATTNIGYVAPDCSAADVVLQTDGLACEPVAECTGDEVLNTATNECDLDCPTGMMEDPENPDMCIADAPVQTPQPTTNTGGGDDDDLQGVLQVAAGAGVIAFFLAYAAGDASNFAFSPDVGYSIDESGYAYNYGGRVDFRKSRWHLYWTAGQANTNGDFGDLRYSSGGSYAADFWTAAFSERVQGDAADYDLSLSAKYGEGIWEVSPAYRVHFGFEETASGVESEINNSLNLEGVLRYHRWTLRPTAGFQWQNADDFADNARFGISAVRNF